MGHTHFFKWFEGACYAVRYQPLLTDVRGAVDRYVRIFAKLQEPSGFLGTRISPSAPLDRRVNHDLYVAGHFFEAAVAHHRATGERLLLDAAVRLANFYIAALNQGHPYFEDVGTREHPEIELALVRLARATGQKNLLELSAIITRKSKIGPTLADVHAGGGKLHAVRLCYLLAGAAELYIATGEKEFYRHLPGLWKEIVSTRMYVTGGIGYRERVPERPYDLPQWLPNHESRDIAETCASVALMMFSWRLAGITGESRYMDVVETILYNHYLGALSRDHLANFYYNPVRRTGDLAGKTDHGGSTVERTRLPAIHSTACCMPNAWRFFSQLPEYVFSASGEEFAVHLYGEADARCLLADGTSLTVEMHSRYPHDGLVRFSISPGRPARFKLLLRIPAWCEAARVSVAGEAAVRATSGQYHAIERLWIPGDEVELELSMAPVCLASRPEIVANRGQVAFRRGPLVYCLEKEDAAGLDLERLVVELDGDQPSRSVRAELDPKLGLHVLLARAGERPALAEGLTPYVRAPALVPTEWREIRLVPFYFRANRGKDTRWITFLPYE